MTKSSVVVEQLGKKFGLSLRSALKYGLVDSLRRSLGRGKDQRLRPGEFWALQNVSFSLEPGDAMGIMGANGSGKTTLLRILNGTFSPDTGKVAMRGRIGSLIAAGAGFSPMLTGRENVFISGALLGMGRAEIRKRFDEIVAFSELEEFIDMPVRNYSSGMSVRLGFSVAVLGTPDVLLVDEVLAVGDIAFQKKCYERILALKAQGTTVLLVSHAIGAIWAVCNKGLFLNKGLPLVVGDVEKVCKAYDEQNALNARVALEKEQSVAAAASIGQDGALPTVYGHSRGGTGDVECLNVRLLSAFTGLEVEYAEFGESFFIEYSYVVRKTIPQPIFRSSFDAVHYKFIVSIDSYEQGYSWDVIGPGKYKMCVKLESQFLRPGLYTINTSVVSRGIGVHLFYWLGATSFTVRHPENRFLYSNENAIVFFPVCMNLAKEEE
ncbi:ABC transporter ATP-binding protein [Nitratidesulfovibrio sp. D1]|uniref:ABC transporter ATP-binding protein n=1 Tax=Nitratidesulfovibrio sp. D1 TaxID=3440151 RepID=UPI003EBF56FC